MNYKIDKSLIITVVIVAAVLLGVNMILTSLNPNTDTVNVQGNARISVVPDLVSVNFAVETKGKTSIEAKDANSKILNQLIQNLENEGFDRSEIETMNFNIYQDYTWNNGERKENGFKATHSVRVEVDAEDTQLLSKVVDRGVDAGAMVNNINFELTIAKQNEAKAQALKLAAQDAKLKAESLAAGFDKKLGKLVSTSTNDFGYRPWNVYSAGAKMDMAVVEEAVSNIQPTEQDVSVTVSAVYKIR